MEQIINPSSINIYGINAFINKFNTTNNILNLDTLKDTFKIDNTFDPSSNQIETAELPAYTQLTYNERITEQDVKYSTSYNRPPIGPIENFCYCYNCNNISPQYHTENCPYPEKKSLLLTLEGVYHYVILNTSYSGPLDELKELWENSKLTQSILNKYSLIPDYIKINNGDVQPDKSLTNISYFDVVKTRGPQKIEYSTATTKFSNNIFLTYELNNNKKTSIRISKNGLINLINIPYSESDRNKLYSTLIDRVNSDSENVDIEEFNSAINGDYDKYSIINKYSYIHSMNSQFQLWEIKDKYSIYFNKLNDLISPYGNMGKTIPGQFTEIENNNGKQIIKLINPLNKSESINIINWVHSLGKLTKNQTKTREEIKCIILPIDGIKISVQIHKHGTFQMSMSYCNSGDIKNNICKSVITHENLKLEIKYLELVQRIFVNIFNIKPDLVYSSLDYLVEDITEAKNTVSGNKPPKRLNSSTEVCRSKDPRQGYPGLRPLPYSWKGKCPESRQYLDFIGVQGADNLYYPCCASKNKNSEEFVKKYLISGFPKDIAEQNKYSVNKYEDRGSGVIIPGSMSVGSITNVLINGSYKKVEIISFVGVKPKVFTVKDLQTGKIFKVDRTDLQRDSRYFPGLKSFSKDKLINCIIKNIKQNDKIKNVFNLQNLTELKSLIDNVESISQLTFYNISIFRQIKFYVTSIPEDSEQYYLIITPEESYYINNYGNKEEYSLSENINKTIIFNGFKTENKYYITDLLYYNKKINNNFSDKIELLNELQMMYFLSEQNIEFNIFEENVIKSSADLLIETTGTNLIFIPEKGNPLIWNDIVVEKELVLQIIKKDKTNYFTLGLHNTPITGFNIDFSSIYISKIFMENNNLKINDYVLFKFDYNIQTGLFSSRPLQPIEKVDKPDITIHKTMNNISLILNPIKESFFLNNKLESDYIWVCPDFILKYVDDSLPLIEFI